MNNRRSLLMLCAAAFAAALVAFPGSAYAEGRQQTDSSHAKIEGRAESEAYYDHLYQAVADAASGETVKLIEDDTTPYSKGVDVKTSITIDLGGKTLTGATGDAALNVSQAGAEVTIKSGAVISPSQQGIYENARDAKVTLEDVVVTSTSSSYGAAYVVNGGLEIKGNSSLTSTGQPTLMIADNPSAAVTVVSGTINGDVKNSRSLTFEDGTVTGKLTSGGINSSLTVRGGTFKGEAENTGGTLTVTGGNFKDSGLLEGIGDDRTMFYHLANDETGAPAYYEVTTKPQSELKDDAGYILYFDSRAYIFYEHDESGSVGPIVVVDGAIHMGIGGPAAKGVYRATFKNGDTEFAHYGRTEGEVLGTLPTPTSETDAFEGWYTSGGTKVSESTTVWDDVEYFARWTEGVAEFGGVKYKSLQDAISAATKAGGEATVTLLKDSRESVTIGFGDKLTIDLGGHVLTNSGSGAITVNGRRNLTVVNGTVNATSGDCLLLKNGSDGSAVMLGDAGHKLTFNCTSAGADNAVCVQTASSVTFNAGTYTSKGNYAVFVYSDAGSSPIVVNGGSFTGTKYSMLLNGGAATISGGSMAGNVGMNSRSSLAITGGSVGGHVVKTEADTGASLNITGGTFGDNTNSEDIDADEYHMLQNAGGKYVVSAHDKDVTYTPAAGTGKAKKVEYCKVDSCTWSKEMGEVDAPQISGLEAGKSYDDTDGVRKTFTVSFDGAYTVKAGGETISKNADGSYTLPYGENLEVVAEAEGGQVKSVLTVSNYRDHDWHYVEGGATEGDTHTLTCAHDGCTVKTKTEAHTGGKATCRAQATCTVCGAKYGELDPNNHEGGPSSTYQHDATNHWKTYTCHASVAYPNTAHAHTLRTVIDEVATADVPGREHDVCDTCGYTSAERTIPATGDAPAIIGLVDGGSYDLAEGSPVFVVSSSTGVQRVTIGGVEVNPTTAGGNTYALTEGENMKVVATGANGKQTAITVSCYATHDWGAWESKGDGTHFHYCKHTGCGKREVGDCSGGKATCASPAICSTCNQPYGQKDSTNHTGSTTWHYGDSEHWKTCDSCGEEISGTRAAHNLTGKSDETGHWQECACGYKTAVEHHSLVWKSDGAQHWRECENCSYRTEKTDHDLSEWERTATGHKHVCKTCGYTTEEAAHTYGEWQEAADGSKHEHTCGDCGYTETADHSYVWVTEKEATATEDGLKREECEVCHHQSGKTEVIPKTGGDDSGDDDDKGDDSGEKGDDSGDDDDSGDGGEKPDYKPDYKPSAKPDKKPTSKPDPELPATGDPLIIISGIATAGTVLAATGAIRRRK